MYYWSTCMDRDLQAEGSTIVLSRQVATAVDSGPPSFESYKRGVALVCIDNGARSRYTQPRPQHPNSSSKKGCSGSPLRKSQKSTQTSSNPKGRPLGRLILTIFSRSNNTPSPPTLSRYTCNNRNSKTKAWNQNCV